jgi:hypothetical protein
MVLARRAMDLAVDFLVDCCNEWALGIAILKNA